MSLTGGGTKHTPRHPRHGSPFPPSGELMLEEPSWRRRLIDVLWITRPEGGAWPRGFGIVSHHMDRGHVRGTIIPFNLLIGWSKYLYWNIRFGWAPHANWHDVQKAYAAGQDDAWRKAWDAGRGSGYSSGYDAGWAAHGGARREGTMDPVRGTMIPGDHG